MYEQIQFFRDRRKVKKHTQHYISIFLYFVPDLQRRVFITTVHFFFIFKYIFTKHFIFYTIYIYIQTPEYIIHITQTYYINL